MRIHFDDVAQTADVDVPAALRVAFTPHHAGDRCEMDDAAAAGDRIPDAPGVPHVPGFTPRSPDIQPTDFRAACCKRRAQGATDQSFRTGDEYRAVHARVSARLQRSGALRR